MGLELADDDPLLAEAFEQRGVALRGLRRSDEAVIAWERALALHADRRDDAGIVRAAGVVAQSLAFSVRFPEAIDALNRAVKRLSSTAAAERAVLHATLTLPSLHVSPPDIAWDYLEQAVATAERIGNPSLTGHVLLCKAMAHHYCGEPEAVLEPGEQALSLMREEALGDRVELMLVLLFANYRTGRFADVDRLIPELEVMARRAGRHELLAFIGSFQSTHQLNLTGDLRAFLERMEVLDTAPQWHFLFLPTMAAARLHLGETEHALAQLASAVAEPMPSLVYKGVAEALRFGGTAMLGRVEDALTLFGDVEPWLPAVGKRNIRAAWTVLDVSVPGLMLAHDVVRCGALYPSCVNYVGTFVMAGEFANVMGNPQTAAGIAAHAAGLRDRARDHFETAIRQADTLPHRLLQPAARYWYGRLLVDDPHPAEQARGRAMIEAAATDFRSLEIVTYATLAEQFLRQ